MADLHKSLYISESHDPAFNLAVEEYLVQQCQKDEVIMYLWQNEKTVVIGKHQNPYKECDLKRVRQDGISLMRRKSGGGAVFHDLGNQNFSFIAHEDNYNLEQQFKVILDAMEELGIPAVLTGRNDMTVDGRKFSGNAFMHQKNVSCHHGTLLVDSKLGELGKYLTPSKVKTASKGVSSVRSRVVNLIDYHEGLDVTSIRTHLAAAFSNGYKGTIALKDMPELEKIEAIAKAYREWSWTIGESPKATLSYEKNMAWGNFELSLFIKNGLITECSISTDTLIEDYYEELADALIDKEASVKVINRTIKACLVTEEIIEELGVFVEEMIGY